MTTIQNKWVRRTMLLAVFAGLLSLTAGCRTQTADASDSDPHYYKGTDFHGKQRKA